MGKFISWYRQPRSNAGVEYLALMPATDHDEGGYFYTRVIENAHRFDTYEDAKRVTPVYDGSHDIEGRSGVLEVFVDHNNQLARQPDPWVKPLLIFAAVVVAYFIWQFAR